MKFSYRDRFALPAIGFLVAAVLVSSVVLYSHSKKAVEKTVSFQVQRMSEMTAGSIKECLNEQKRVLSQGDVTDTIRNIFSGSAKGEIDHQKIADVFFELKKNSPLIENVLFVNERKKIVAKARPMENKEAGKEIVSFFRKGVPEIGLFPIDEKRPGVKTRYLGIYAPIEADGRIAGGLISLITPEDFGTWIGRRFDMGKKASITVYGADGRVVAHSGMAERGGETRLEVGGFTKKSFQKLKEAGTGPHQPGKISAFAAVLGTNWKVVVAMDKSHLLTPFFAIREMMVLWVMALVFGASVILYLVFHYLNVPVQQMVAGTSKISRGVENGSDHILYMSDSFADRTKQEAAVIEETSVAMEQISAAIRRNAENAKEASELMSQAKMEVIDANDTMDELVESMDNIHKASRKTVEIIKTIDDIAFQTNILALNASVEAEKAGEYGLGFGVIAKEIASLARRSAKEARNTSDRIEEGLKIVDDGSDLVMKVGMSFRQLDFKIRKATTLAGEIATATDEQAKGMEQVNQSVAEIDKSIRQNATDAENFVRETDNMLNQAIWLNKWMDELTNQIGVRNGEGMAALWNRVSGEVGPVSKRLQAIGNQPGDLVFSDNKRPVVELPEHALFMNRFYCVCNRMKQEDKYRFSVACFGIDHLNVLNETFGTGVSNRVTRHFRNVLEKRVGRGCVLSRCGDGEYIVLMEDTQSREEAMKRVQEMQREFDRPVNIRKESLRVTAAAGVIYCEPGRYEPLEILNSAKNAMWFSRLGKKDGCYLYNERVYRRVLDFFQLESELQNAIDRNEFELFYQPIIELETGRIIGTEALIRWRHPERGLISPADFLPLAEENGMIVPIGKWVFQQACHQAGRFMKRRNGGEPFILGINVSLKQLLDDKMPGELKQILNESRLSPEQLRLELTEGMMAGEEKDILPLLNELKNMGVRLAIDDFGARRLSLNTLDRLPVDTLKIDGSWVEKTTGKDAGSSPDLLHGVMDLASRLQMSVIAEGVETCVQIEKLKKLQCLYGQGYYYSKPMNYENFLHAMEKEIYVNLPERYYEKVEGR